MFNDQFLFYFALKSYIKKYINNDIEMFKKTFTMLYTVFILPPEQRALQFFIEEFLIYQYYFEIFDSNLNKYFITDFYNYKNKLEQKKYHKILTFFNKLIYIVFFLLDPFFFKYF